MNIKSQFKERYKSGYSHMAIRATMENINKEENEELEKLLRTHEDNFNKLPLKYK